MLWTSCGYNIVFVFYNIKLPTYKKGSTFYWNIFHLYHGIVYYYAFFICFHLPRLTESCLIRIRNMSTLIRPPWLFLFFSLRSGSSISASSLWIWMNEACCYLSSMTIVIIMSVAIMLVQKRRIRQNDYTLLVFYTLCCQSAFIQLLFFDIVCILFLRSCKPSLDNCCIYVYSWVVLLVSHYCKYCTCEDVQHLFCPHLISFTVCNISNLASVITSELWCCTKHRDGVRGRHWWAAVHYTELLLVSVCVFPEIHPGPKGSPAKWLFFPPVDHKAINMSASWHCPLDTEAGLANADCCSLHNSAGPLPGHSIVIQLFLDKSTQINIYSCLQVRGPNELQGGWQRINYSM